MIKIDPLLQSGIGIQVPNGINRFLVITENM